MSGSVLESLDKAFEAASVVDSDFGITVEGASSDDDTEKESATVGDNVEASADGGEPIEDSGSSSDTSNPDVDPPADWDDEAKERFKAIPSRELKQYLSERAKHLQGQHTRRMQEVQKKYGDYDEHIGPYLEHLTELGYSPGQAFQQLMTVQQRLDRDPYNTLLWLANSYGINLANPNQQAAPNQPQLTYAIERELAPIRQWIHGQQQSIERQQQEAEQTRIQAMASELSAFGQEKDEAGNFKRPYFMDVIPALTAHVNQIMSEDGASERDYKEIVHQAYELAVKPFKKMIDDDVKRRAEAAKKSQGASLPRSGGSIGKVSGGGKKRSVLESLDSAFSQHSRA